MVRKIIIIYQWVVFHEIFSISKISSVSSSIFLSYDWIVYFSKGRSLDLFDPFDEVDLASHQMQNALQYILNTSLMNVEHFFLDGYKIHHVFNLNFARSPVIKNDHIQINFVLHWT